MFGTVHHLQAKSALIVHPLRSSVVQRILVFDFRSRRTTLHDNELDGFKVQPGGTVNWQFLATWPKTRGS